MSLAEKLIRENIETKNPYLDLGNCGLDGTEPELELLAECEHLETLVFSNFWWEFNIEKRKRIKNKTQNKGLNNALYKIPNLPEKIQKLVLFNQKIGNAYALSDLNSLTYLDISLNDIDNFDFLNLLYNLNYLDISNNLFFNNEYLNLDKLIYVNISFISIIKQVNSGFLGFFPNAEYLDVVGNNIGEISYLKNIKNIKFLDMRDCHVSDISSLIGLNKLEILSLSKNPITDFSPLQSLSALRELYATDCQISDISVLQGLQNITDLSLSKNQIKHLSLEFLNSLPKLEKLYLYKNPIENLPEEVFNRDENVLPEVRAYLESIAKTEDRRELNEAKLIIVGVGKVGKSELVEALTEESYSFVAGRQETKGIKIKEWQLACPREQETVDFRANIWDFAGQEIDYGTHQFFLTKNSVYVFVWDRRTGEQEGKFDYWLNIVSLLSQNAPVFVVQNKIDEGHTEINQQEWKNAFPHIAGFFKTSCATGEGIDALREAIKKQLFALPTTREIWNKYRVAVRTALENHTADYISYRDYLRICETEGLPAQDAPFLAQQLHDIGVILHFADDISLKNTVVLKTDWAIDAAYHLLDTKKVENGRFEVQDLERIWTEARFDEKHDFLLKLIQRFELIFPFQDTQIYIVPAGLSPQSPDFPPLSSALLRFEYHYNYKFMPKGILSRFICREHRLIKEAFFWKYGVVLEYEQGTQAVVTLWEIDKVLRVEIVGKYASKLLAIIRKSIDDIHNSLKNPPLQEKIPCLCAECKANAKPYLHDYKTLLKFQDKGRETKECNHSAEDVNIAQLLEGIENPTQAREKPLHATIQKALSRLEEATYQGYFEEMDKLVLPAYLKGLYSQLKLQFISSPTSWNFNQQLETFAREANQYL